MHPHHTQRSGIHPFAAIQKLAVDIGRCHLLSFQIPAEQTAPCPQPPRNSQVQRQHPACSSSPNNCCITSFSSHHFQSRLQPVLLCYSWLLSLLGPSSIWSSYLLPLFIIQTLKTFQNSLWSGSALLLALRLKSDILPRAPEWYFYHWFRRFQDSSAGYPTSQSLPA